MFIIIWNSSLIKYVLKSLIKNQSKQLSRKWWIGERWFRQFRCMSHQASNDTASSLAHFHQALLFFPINLLCRPPLPAMIIQKCEKRFWKKHIWCYFSERLFQWKLGRTAVSGLRTASKLKNFGSFHFNRPTWNW